LNEFELAIESNVVGWVLGRVKVEISDSFDD